MKIYCSRGGDLCVYIAGEEGGFCLVVVVGGDLHTRDIARDVEVRCKYPHTINITGGEILQS